MNQQEYQCNFCTRNKFNGDGSCPLDFEGVHGNSGILSGTNRVINSCGCGSFIDNRNPTIAPVIIHCETCDKYDNEKHQQIMDSCPMFSSPYLLGMYGSSTLLADFVARCGCQHHPVFIEKSTAPRSGHIKDLELIISLCRTLRHHYPSDISLQMTQEQHERELKRESLLQSTEQGEQR